MRSLRIGAPSGNPADITSSAATASSAKNGPCDHDRVRRMPAMATSGTMKVATITTGSKK